MDNMMSASQGMIESLVDETVDEITGRSSKKWLLVLLALVLGATLALALVNRQQRAKRSAAAHADEVAVPEVPAAAS